MSQTETCNWCKKPYEKRHTESRGHWAKRTACSPACANRIRSANKLTRAEYDRRMQERAEANLEHNTRAVNAYLARAKASAAKQRRRREFARLGAYL